MGLVQKSGYFGRSAAPNARDLDLIRRSAAVGARAALDGVSGVAGMDEDNGGKPFDIETPWFTELLEAIGQPNGLNREHHKYLRTNAGIRKSLWPRRWVGGRQPRR